MYNLYFCETFSDILFSESSLPTKTDNYNTRPQVMRLQYIHKNVSKNLRYIKTNIGFCNVPDKDTDIVGEGSL